MDPFLPVQVLLWAAVAVLLSGEAALWWAGRQRRRPPRWAWGLRWLTLLFLAAAAVWFVVVFFDFLSFIES